MTKEQIEQASDRALKSNIATLNPAGNYGHVVAMSKAELDKRGVDYSDCLTAEAR